MTTATATITTPAKTGIRPAAIASTVLWTVAGVGTLVLLGKGIAAAGSAAGLPNACWQMTGARAAAVAGTLGSLVAMRRGHVALFGILYAAYLLSTHATTATFSSALVAGVVAWIVALALHNRSMPVRLVATLLTFNALLTLGAAFKMTQGAVAYSQGLGMRMLATVLVCAAIVGVAKLVRSADR